MRVGINKNHVFEEIAVKHRLDGNVADDDGRNGKQDQRQGNNQRAFVRIVVFAQAVMLFTMMIVMMLRQAAPFLFTVEHHKVLAERVKRGNEHAGEDGEISKAAARQGAVFRCFDNRIFGIEAGEERRTNQRQVTDQHGQPSNRHVFFQVTHVAHILVMVHTDNRATCGQEQQGFKESVGHHMEHRHGIGRRTQSHSHVAQLRQGGIRNHTFDVVLNHAQETHKQGSNRTDYHDDRQGSAAHLINRRHTRYHEQTSGNHGCGVNQCRNRGRTFHRIRQPDVQRELCRFTHRTDKQEQTSYGNQRPFHTGEQLNGGRLNIRQISEYILIAQAAAEIGKHQTDTEQKAEVADTVNQKGFQVGKSRARTFEIETDQEIRHQAHSFPAEEELDEVVAHNQHQHAESKQRNIAEEALVADFFIVHITDGIDMYHQRYAGNHDHHHRRHRIDQEADGEIQAAHCQPGIDVFVELSAAAVNKAPQHISRQHGGH